MPGERASCPEHLGQRTQLRKLGEEVRPDHCVGWRGEIGGRVGVGVGRKEFETMPPLPSPHTHTHIQAYGIFMESLVHPWAFQYSKASPCFPGDSTLHRHSPFLILN